ncbi:hypothetical protein FIBSPDRAFT_868352 [Athelia psychrophila]|uniref:Uncharacterized protein n=1 Tax=Athelia psychrophila TaxID=1759441 RepID=A0A166D713_9AGAM|nr:hypothetical protein FIBSPDRAFT_868352 [Fibularhizoctonia sp. CBS 109695]
MSLLLENGARRTCSQRTESMVRTLFRITKTRRPGLAVRVLLEHGVIVDYSEEDESCSGADEDTEEQDDEVDSSADIEGDHNGTGNGSEHE